MIDKTLVKKRFKKSLKTYNENAFVQKHMAEKLISLINKNKFNKVLEVGCSTGILTEKIKENIKFEHFYANDIVSDSKTYIEKIIPEVKFITGDIEEVETGEKYDLIISNACLQWCNDIDNVIKKLYDMLLSDGILAFSVFGDENLKELVSILNLPKRNINLDVLKNNFDIVYTETEKVKIYFDKPKDILTHLKYTGANALTEFKFTKSILNKFEADYKNMYTENGKVYLTYNPVYVVITK